MTLFSVWLAACTSGLRPTTPSQIPPTAAPVVLATPVPSATATPIQPRPTPIAPPAQVTSEPDQRTVYVVNTGSQGLVLRQTPGGRPLGSVPEGSALTTSGEEQRAGDRLWRQVTDARGRQGWVAADFLMSEAPRAATPSVVAAASPTATREVASADPTWPVPLIPTATLRPASSAPTRTPRPRESPAPVRFPTPGPVIVPALPATRPAVPATNQAAPSTRSP